ncbi:MAG: T9SS type A sorting domain-containing protein, partial [Calditrichaeota bacterium]|nr:T9SS type A sorting domain-containing protein [Calditrichota bacterium]
MKHKVSVWSVAVLTLLFFSTGWLIAQTGKERVRIDPSERPIPDARYLIPPQPLEVVPLPFFDDFEGASTLWTADGQFNRILDAQNYQVLNPAINPTLVHLPDDGHLPGAFSGQRMWWFGETATGTFIGPGWDSIPQAPLNGGTSAELQTGSLISPAIDLTGVSQASLRFQTWWEIEGVDVDQYDLMFVEISLDNGATFLPIGRGLINPLNDVDGESWKSYSSAGLGLPGIWIEQLFDLTPFVGNMAYLRFRFNTEDELYNGFRGWFIDDVSVTSDALPAPQITAINPSTSAPFELVTLTGLNFVNGATVAVGDSVTSAVISTNTAIFEVPFLPPGQYDVTLTNPDGQFATVVNGLTITDQFPPHIFLIDPDSAEVGTSVAVTITGGNFQAGATAGIGTVALSNLTVVNEFTITGDSPSTLPAGLYNVRVVNPDGQFDQLITAFRVYSPVGIEDDLNGAPLRFELAQNYPNPFNPQTNIDYSLAQGGPVKLMVYNLLGETVAVLVNEFQSAGTHRYSWKPAATIPSGIYLYRLEAGSLSAV